MIERGRFCPQGETVHAYTTTQARLSLTGDGVVPGRVRDIQDGVPITLDIDAYRTQSLRTTQHFDDRFLGIQTVPGYPLIGNSEVIDLEPVELVYHFSEVDDNGMITATAQPLVWEFEIDLGLGTGIVAMGHTYQPPTRVFRGVVPEPTSVALLLIGMIGTQFRRLAK